MIKNKLDELNTKYTEFKEECQKFKPELEKFIHDETIPLDKRWEVWLSAPKECKKEKDWVQHIEGLDISWFDDFYMNRNQFKTVENLVQIFYDQIDCGSSDTLLFTEENLVKFKEHFLKLNLYGFVLDW